MDTEPLKKKKDKEAYKKALLNIKGLWDLEPEIKKNRKQVEKRLAKQAL